MRDFNTVKSDLIRKLSLSCQKTDGEILWYEGTLDVLIEFLSMFFFIPKWIPVTEQLPPVEKEVYVTDGEYIAIANLLDEVFPGDKPCWSYSGLGEITHWCEQIQLPQPLKEDET